MIRKCKLFGLLLITCAYVLSYNPQVVKASDSTEPAISVQSLISSTISATLNCSSGKASWSITVLAVSGTTRVVADVTLQKISATGSILSETSWNDITSSSSYLMSSNSSDVTSGYTYRLCVSVTTYQNGKTEVLQKEISKVY